MPSQGRNSRPSGHQGRGTAALSTSLRTMSYAPFSTQCHAPDLLRNLRHPARRSLSKVRGRLRVARRRDRQLPADSEHWRRGVRGAGLRWCGREYHASVSIMTVVVRRCTLLRHHTIMNDIVITVRFVVFSVDTLSCTSRSNNLSLL